VRVRAMRVLEAVLTLRLVVLEGAVGLVLGIEAVLERAPLALLILTHSTPRHSSLHSHNITHLTTSPRRIPSTKQQYRHRRRRSSRGGHGERTNKRRTPILQLGSRRASARRLLGWTTSYSGQRPPTCNEV
jgi:hypothetical protein